MKKFISLMCLILTFATLLCACNGEEPVETQPVTESVTTTEPAPETTKKPAPSVKVEPYVDIDGTLTAKATRVSTMDIGAFYGEGGYYKHAQGGCIMGDDYLITCMHSPTTNNIPEKVCLVKSDLKTGKIVAKSDNLALGHANDATYNPDDNVIVVSDMDENNTVHIVDADSLEIKKAYTLSTNGTPIGYIAYDEVNKRYVCLGTAIDYIYVYSRDFKLLKVVKCSGLRDSEEYDNPYLGNGAVTDGKYVYIPEWHGGAIWPPNATEKQIKTYLRIIDASTGKDVDLIELGFQREPEFIAFYKGKFYIGCNNKNWTGMEFYKVEITTTKS